MRFDHKTILLKFSEELSMSSETSFVLKQSEFRFMTSISYPRRSRASSEQRSELSITSLAHLCSLLKSKLSDEKNCFFLYTSFWDKKKIKNLLADRSVEQLQERWWLGHLFPEIQVERVFLTSFQPLRAELETPRRPPLVNVNVLTLIHAAKKVQSHLDNQQRVKHEFFPFPLISDAKVRNWLNPICHRSHHVPFCFANLLKHRPESLSSYKSYLASRQASDLAILCFKLVDLSPDGGVAGTFVIVLPCQK